MQLCWQTGEKGEKLQGNKRAVIGDWEQKPLYLPTVTKVPPPTTGVVIDTHWVGKAGFHYQT